MRLLIVFLLCVSQITYSQTSDLPFQVLVAEKAKASGLTLEPLKFVDDVTSIEMEDGGFVALVHEGGTTYELTEKTFTFYLKPEKLKSRDKRPPLDMLYMDSTSLDKTKNITVLHPKFDATGLIRWQKNTPIGIYWLIHDGPVISYKISVSDHTGKKIQDYGTKNNFFELKPYNYGLQETSFIFQISSTFAGETITSKRYHIEMEEAPVYLTKASDLVLKALDLELSPMLALEVWKEALASTNGKFYQKLFEKFIQRNESVISASGQDIEQLLSQNK